MVIYGLKGHDDRSHLLNFIVGFYNSWFQR